MCLLDKRKILCEDMTYGPLGPCCKTPRNHARKAEKNLTCFIEEEGVLVLFHVL